jgi:NADH-quinone oxidoreductase subunit J
MEWLDACTSAPQFAPMLVASVVAIVGGIMMVTRRDVVRGALWLVLTLVAVAVLYATLAADLLAMVQVIVYAGAIMVLFLFVIILLAAGREPLALGQPGWEGVAAPALGLVLLVVLAASVATSGLWRVSAHGQTVAAPFPDEVGQALFSGSHALAVELISVLLVVAMIGVIVLAKGLRAERGH